MNGEMFIAGAEYSETEGKWVWKYHGREVHPDEWGFATNDTDGFLEMAFWNNFKLERKSSLDSSHLLCMADVK